MKKLILSSLLFVSLIGVGAGAYIINGSYSPLNTAINVELGDKFGYVIVLDSTSFVDSTNNTNDFVFNPCADKTFTVSTSITSDDSSLFIDFGLSTYFTKLQGVSNDGLEIKSIEFDLENTLLDSITDYVSIYNFTESSVGYFVPSPDSGTPVIDFSIVPLQKLEVNSIIITLGI